MEMRAATTVLPALIGLVMSAAGHGATWEQRAWQRTTYYRGTFASEQAAAGTLRVAAVDRYEVWFNGDLVGGDSTWTRALTFPVDVLAGDNHLALRVVNRGLGVGNGLLALVQAQLDDSLLVASSTTDRSLVPWYWSAGDGLAPDWTVADVARDRRWSHVQEGSMELAAVDGLPRRPPTVIAGFAGDVDIGTAGGGLTLKSVDGVNLARGSFSTSEEATDGDLTTGWIGRIRPINQSIDIDLGRRRPMHRVRVITLGGTEAELKRNSLRGYAVERSHDRSLWIEVGLLRNIQEYARTEVTFPSERFRFLRVLVVEATESTQPQVAELEVFGTGFVLSGTYDSPPLDLGTPGQLKNFGRIRWEADVPVGATLSLQFRTGNQPEAFAESDSGWSVVADTSGLWFPAAEPARWLQYRVHLRTQRDDIAPVLRSLAIDYSADRPVSGARGRVVPNRLAMGLDTMFVYTLDLEAGDGDLGIERLELDVPGTARLLDVRGPADVGLAEWSSTNQHLTLRFDPPVLQTAPLELRFASRTFVQSHRFRSRLFAPGSDNPANVAEHTGSDPLSGEPYSIDLVATDALGRRLSAATADPPVITPNGDGRNEDTVLGFVLARTTAAVRVDVDLYDLAGRRVRRLGLPPLPAGDYRRAGGDRVNQALWDGRDDGGRLVPPGIYLFRVEADLGAGSVVRAGTVAVAY